MDNFKEWIKIRNLIFGFNCQTQNVRLALDLAAKCTYPDAQWLSQVAQKYRSYEKLSMMVMQQPEQLDDGGRLLCFQSLFSQHSENSLRLSASLGYGYAQAHLASALLNCEKDEAEKFARLAAAQNEPEGFFVLAHLCLDENDGVNAAENYLRAHNLGRGMRRRKNFAVAHCKNQVYATACLGGLKDKMDPERWNLWGLAAKNGCSGDFVEGFVSPVNEHFEGLNDCPAVVFAIGKVLKGNVHLEKRKIFDMGLGFKRLSVVAFRAIEFYEAQVKAARHAVDAWSMVATRLKVVKDIRILIAKKVWAARELAQFAQVRRNKKVKK